MNDETCDLPMVSYEKKIRGTVDFSSLSPKWVEIPRQLNDGSLTEAQMVTGDRVLSIILKNLRILSFSTKSSLTYFLSIKDEELILEGVCDKEDEEIKFYLNSLKYTEIDYYTKLSIKVEEGKYEVRAKILSLDD